MVFDDERTPPPVNDSVTLTFERVTFKT